MRRFLFPVAIVLVLATRATAAPDGVPERVKELGRWYKHLALSSSGREVWTPADAARLLGLYRSAYLHLDFQDAYPTGMVIVPTLAAQVDELQAYAAANGIDVRNRVCLTDRPDVMVRPGDYFTTCSATRGATGTCDWEGAMDGRLGEREFVVKSAGVATGGSADSLIDTSKTWILELYRRRLVVLRPGTPSEERRRVRANSASEIQADRPWTQPPQVGDAYEIRGSFDPGWFMRTTREVHEATLRRFWEDRRICGDTPCLPAPFPLDPLDPRNARGFVDWVSRDALKALASDTSVPAYYGWGYDGDEPITQSSALPHQWRDPHFRVSGVVTDLRNPAYRAWRVRQVLYRLQEHGLAPGEGACLAVEAKPGFYAWYDERALGPSDAVCGAPNTNTWFGPTQICRDTSSMGGPMHPTQYGPGEYEAGISAYLRELIAVLAENGYGDARILSVETPAFGQELWSTLADDVRRLPQMWGVRWGTIEPSLSVLATASAPPPPGDPGANAPPPAPGPSAPPASTPSWSLGGDEESGSPITQTGASSWSDAPSASRSSSRGGVGGRGDMQSGGGGGDGAAVEAPSLR